MSATPTATPVAKAPPQNAPVSERVPRSHLRAPIALSSTKGQWELESGEMIIGRDPSVQVVLDDPLASRFHARLCVTRDGRVLLEDLQSANGVFVNGIKVTESATILGEGDRLLVGTTEFGLFALRPSKRVPRGTETARMPAVSVPPAMQSNEFAADRDAPPRSSRGPIAGGARSEPIDMVGHFAEELMGSGHPLEASRTLSEYLHNLLKGASAGLTVPPQLLEKATRHALRLHGWTQRSDWLKYVFELHLACLQVPSDVALRELEPALRAARDIDDSFLAYFVMTLQSRHEPLSYEESVRLRRFGTRDGFARKSP
jgi:hypothetical protein